jgi:hypothetical protein
MMDDHDFWYKVAAWTFGLWALAVPIGVALIRSAVTASMVIQEKFISDFHAYVLTVERRMTRLEERMKISEHRDN